MATQRANGQQHSDLATLPEETAGPAKVKERDAGSRRRRPRQRAASSGDPRRRRIEPPFPRTTFEDALALGEAIQKHAAGQKIRRLTLFEKMDKSSESGSSRMMITNSGKYGITTGGCQTEFIELMPKGSRATSPESSPEERLRTRFQLAIEDIGPFKYLYETNKGKRIPSPEVMREPRADCSRRRHRRVQSGEDLC